MMRVYITETIQRGKDGKRTVVRTQLKDINLFLKKVKR